MKERNHYVTIIALGLVVGLILGTGAPGYAGEQTLELAFRPPTEIRRVQPPRETRNVPPPREVRRVRPPRGIRQVAPPRDVRKVQPPRDAHRVRPARDFRHRTRPAQVERRWVAPPRELRPARVRRIVPRPDLRVRAIGLSSTRPRVGERVVVTARVRNSGNKSARRFRVRFFAGNRQISEETVSLAPGTTEMVTAAFVADNPGRQRVRVQVDPARGQGKQVASSRRFTVKSAPSPMAPTDRQLEKPKVAKLRGDRVTGVVGEPPGTGGRGGAGTSGSHLARLPDYRGPMKKPQTKPDVAAPKQRPPAGGDKDQEGSGPWSDRFGVPDVPGKDLDDLGRHGKGYRGPKGDGIGGIHDQDGMPDIDLGKGIPKIPDFKVGFPAGKGDVDGGVYGGIHPKYNPGGVYGDPPGKGGGTKPGGSQPAGGKKKGKGKGKKLDQKMKGMMNTMQSTGKVKSTAGIPHYNKKGKMTGFTVIVDYKDGSGRIYQNRGGETKGAFIPKETMDEGWETVWLVYGILRPTEEGASKVDLRHEPQLLLKLTKLAEQQKTGKLRPDESLIDPRPVKTSSKAVDAQGPGGQVASASGTQAGAEAKWKFIGVKPGSGVTDPAEPMGPKGPDTKSGIAPIKHFQVIDPAETASVNAAQGKAQTAAAKAAAGKTAKVASVSGSVQKLSEKSGQQGWAPLNPGDSLGQGSIIRVDKNTGGEVGFASVETALSQSFSKIHDGPDHNVYRVNTTPN